jgi:hypothetical protein
MVVVAWVVTTVAVTLWVTARGEEKVTTGNAMLVGVVAGTVVAVAFARAKKG